VAHTRTKTPTHAAEFLIARVRAADAHLAELTGQVVRSARTSLAATRLSLTKLSRELSLARYQVTDAATRLRLLVRRLRSSTEARLAVVASRSEARRLQLLTVAKNRVRQAEMTLGELGFRTSRSARVDLRRQRTHFTNLARLCRQLSPERTLRRGFSITRGEDGKVLRVAAEVGPGYRLQTQLAKGVINSRVESK
jgi:exodeoxyribonuclease VII large subunit